MFKEGRGDWTQYRKFPGLVEVDFHYADFGRREAPYWEAMDDIWATALEALKSAFEDGKCFVLFSHGWSTSRLGKTTARSQVRGLMRSTNATPYIVRNQCIQHESVFVAAIRPNPNARASAGA